MTATKRCTKCGGTKPFDEYHRDRTAPDGRTWACKECVRDYQAIRKALEPDRVRQLQREATHRFRERHGTVLDGRQRAAYGAAEAELRERHRSEFDAIYDEKLRERGVRSAS